ncbi:hypothetical protein LXL04_031789 [Taraxacum kok-saghyz]
MIKHKCELDEDERGGKNCDDCTCVTRKQHPGFEYIVESFNITANEDPPCSRVRGWKKSSEPCKKGEEVNVGVGRNHRSLKELKQSWVVTAELNQNGTSNRVAGISMIFWLEAARHSIAAYTVAQWSYSSAV